MICIFDEKLSTTQVINSTGILFTICNIFGFYSLSNIFIKKGWEEKDGLFIHNPVCNIPESYLCCQKIPFFSFYKALYTVALFLVLQNL